jgi:YidC/Oxa1 family membrane protein insertase
MQAKMMMFMPVIMLLILYNLPSGLTLYWTVSQIFSILQMLLTQKLTQNTKTDNTGKLANAQRK